MLMCMLQPQGARHTLASYRIQAMIADASLGQRYAILPYQGYLTARAVDFGAAYEQTCE